MDVRKTFAFQDSCFQDRVLGTIASFLDRRSLCHFTLVCRSTAAILFDYAFDEAVVAPYNADFRRCMQHYKENALPERIRNRITTVRLMQVTCPLSLSGATKEEVSRNPFPAAPSIVFDAIALLPTAFPKVTDIVLEEGILAILPEEFENPQNLMALTASAASWMTDKLINIQKIVLDNIWADSRTVDLPLVMTLIPLLPALPHLHTFHMHDTRLSDESHAFQESVLLLLESFSHNDVLSRLRELCVGFDSCIRNQYDFLPALYTKLGASTIQTLEFPLLGREDGRCAELMFGPEAVLPTSLVSLELRWHQFDAAAAVLRKTEFPNLRNLALHVSTRALQAFPVMWFQHLRSIDLQCDGVDADESNPSAAPLAARLFQACTSLEVLRLDMFHLDAGVMSAWADMPWCKTLTKLTIANVRDENVVSFLTEWGRQNHLTKVSHLCLQDSRVPHAVSFVDYLTNVLPQIQILDVSTLEFEDDFVDNAVFTVDAFPRLKSLSLPTNFRRSTFSQLNELLVARLQDLDIADEDLDESTLVDYFTSSHVDFSNLQTLSIEYVQFTFEGLCELCRALMHRCPNLRLLITPDLDCTFEMPAGWEDIEVMSEYVELVQMTLKNLDDMMEDCLVPRSELPFVWAVGLEHAKLGADDDIDFD
jgi:hypothetical protein